MLVNEPSQHDPNDHISPSAPPADGADAAGPHPTSPPDTAEVAALRHEATQLRHRLAEMNTLLDVITDGVVLYGPDGQTLRANGPARRLLGFGIGPVDYAVLTVEERARLYHLRDEFGRALTPDEGPATRIVHGATIPSDEAMDIILTLPDGSERQLSVSGGPLRDADGAITGAIGVYRDVTERRALQRRTTDALRALLAMAETLAGLSDPPTSPPTSLDPDAPPDPNVSDGPIPAPQPELRAAEPVARVIDVIRRVIPNAQAAFLMLLDQRHDTIRPIAASGFPPETEQRWRRHLSQTRASHYLPPTLRERLLSDSAAILDLQQTAPTTSPDDFGLQTLLTIVIPMRDEQLCMLCVGGPAGTTFTPSERELAQAAVHLAALVVEREHLVSEREHATARELALRESNRRMDEFMSIAGHELRTPLTVIKATLQMVRRRIGPLHQNEDRLLMRAERQLQRLERQVDDLVDVSRIQSGNLDLRFEPCDLAPLIYEAVEEQRSTAPDRAIILDAPISDPLPIHADPQRISQVISNLLTNALKYSPTHSPVIARARIRGAHVRVTICDSGPGLTHDQRQRIWDRFHRVAGIAVQSGSGVGLGLGLYISHSIIERHQGRIGVASSPGRGSIFWFTLPLTYPQRPAAPPSP